MDTTISSKGQLVLPSPLRKRDGIRPGERFSIERLEEGRYVLTRKQDTNEGVVDWLLSAPARDWFRPLDSESTDTL